ncbi:hypothetical protein MNBD_PLANCTO02-2800 [hydrothermal vent metagenome]|uniref:Flagellar hook-length control protein-like C-terminal domain-containing protein n=1 Tax=hydrothermal vent metagenome TaxID=652676 RepID=A0A3B1E7L6_9ZZZZ
MPSPNFSSQIDSTPYTPPVTVDAISIGKENVTGQDSGNRSKYIDQLNNAIQQQKPSRKSSQKKKPSTEQTARPVPEKRAPESKTSVESKIESKPKPTTPKTAEETPQPTSQNNTENVEQTEIQQADSVTTNENEEVVSTELEEQNLFNIQSKDETITLAPPVNIEELFQQEVLPEDSQEKPIDPLISNLDPVIPPTGLVAALQLAETNSLEITPQRVESSEEIEISSETSPETEAILINVEQTSSVTEPLTLQNNVEGGEEEKVIPEPTVPKNNVTEPEVNREAVTVENRSGNNVSLQTIESSVEPIEEKSNVLQEDENQKTQNLTNQETQPQENQTVQQPVTKVNVEPSISPVDLKDDASPTPTFEQEAIQVTRKTKGISVSEKLDSQSETSTLPPPSTPFSEVLTEGVTANTGKNAISTQAESIRDQTISAVELAVEQGESLSIRLTPPELGTIQIQLTIEEGAISARLEVQTPEAQTALLQHLQTLQKTLQQNGAPVKNITVQLTPQTAEDQASGDRNQSGEQQTSQEQNEQDQQTDRNQQEQENEEKEENDSNQLNIAA